MVPKGAPGVIEKKSALEKSEEKVNLFSVGPIDFEAKNKILLEKADDIFNKYPPAQWPDIFQLVYDGLGATTKTRTLPTDPALETAGGGSGVKVPQNQDEAIMQSLGF